jgi:hypothetical protein
MSHFPIQVRRLFLERFIKSFVEVLAHKHTVLTASPNNLVH